MGGLGRNPRHGKRPSSSSCYSTVTIVVFVSFCILGVWMFTSSSITPSHSTTTARHSKPLPSSRLFLKDPSTDTDTDTEDDDESKPGSKSSVVIRRPSDDFDQEKEPALDLSGGGEETGVGSTENQEEDQQQQQETQQEQIGGNDESQQQQQQQPTKREDLGDQKRSDEDDRRSAAEEETQLQSEPQQTDTHISEELQNPREERTGNEENQQETQQQENQQEIQDEPEKQRSDNDEDSQRETQQQQQDEGLESKIVDDQQKTHADETQEQEQIQQEAEGTKESQSELETIDDASATDSIPDGMQSEVVPDEAGDEKKPWATQADQSENEKERRKEGEQPQPVDVEASNVSNLFGYQWELCNVTAGPDYIPCLDNEKAIKQLHGFHHYEHRERHCPEESPACLVPLPDGYKRPIEWPKSRDKIWYSNIPHTKLAEVKGHQNWVKVTGEYLTFPGGGTQFIHGALHYIDFIQQSVHDIAWGKHTRVILDVGCGVASFGGFLFERDVLAMSLAPKDEHEAQVQFALERGIPAISAVMGSQRLSFPSRVFDLVHCARCRVPWHADGGTLLLELNRVLRPGGFFVWSATPVYQKLKEDVEIWKAMKSLTVSMCWDLITIKKDKLNGVAAAFFRKPVSNECYDNRKHHSPPMCKQDDDSNAAWYIPMKPCMHRLPTDTAERGSQWPEAWPRRVQLPPYWLNDSQIGMYGKPAPADFTSDYEHWKRVVTKSYLDGLGISWSKVRNVMDMRAVYGGFATALKDMKLWVMNVVNIDAPDTLPIIYERGLFGMYHDWCESFSTYPRTYDLLHADHLFSQLKDRCNIVPVVAEVDRIVRPGGKLIVRDESGMVSELENLLKSLHWDVRLTFSKDHEGILCAEKSDWRPEKFSDSS